jgi:sec-independent protein translocase protein TatB
MFDAGIQELLLIMVIALLVVGPDRLPGLARKAGNFIGKVRHYVAGVRKDIEQELQADDLRNMMQKQSEELDELRGLVSKVHAETEGTLEMVEEDLTRTIDKEKASLEEKAEPAQISKKDDTTD